MASNLVSYLMQFLTPDVIARLAAALGLDTDKVQRGVAAAVPAVLAGLAGVAAQPGGAQKVADAASQQSGVLDNLGGLLSGGNQSSLVQTGSQLLSSLLGGNTSGALANAIGSYSGLGQNAGGSLLGMLAPLVMGGIAKNVGSDLSANGIAGLLAGQKDNIAAAMPTGLKDLLGGTGVLDSLGGAARSASTAASDAAARAAASATTAARSATATAPTPTRSSNWLYWLLAALALLAILYYLFGRPAERTAEQTAPAPETPAQTETQPAQPTTPAPETQTQTQPATPAAPSLTIGGVDVGKQVTDAMRELETTLNGVTDAATAQAAVPKLQTATDAFDKVGGMLGQLSAEQKTMLSDLVKPGITSLNALFDKVLALPGVSDVLKPTIDTLKAKLAALAP
ncbi:DUF937 domain-containing protein [Rhizobium sp. ARZ01]|uniref:DUF937 domain-containing protein n=1 Tax=Rhizobium sp. ARZ01 TaxID=2769313 RepID=UPI001782711E|nr:DUF937 domain-containing protein [Rhizobium sp. ARZ01]MBD9371297.1 DUF937 domain-containing protein [Rhizobium sp. ARZ01]